MVLQKRNKRKQWKPASVAESNYGYLHHFIMPQTDATLQDQHKFALKQRIPGANSMQNLETGKQTNNESKRLFSSRYDILKPIFSRLSSKALLEKCLKVVTQNANESLYLVIWDRCPNSTFYSQVRIESAVTEAVCCFENGAGSKAFILKAAAMEEVGQHSLPALHKEHHLRQVSASQKIMRKDKN